MPYLCRFRRKASQTFDVPPTWLFHARSSGTFQDRRSRLMSLWILRSGLSVHWSGYGAVGCMWWRRPHASSLYSTVAHHSVGRSRRVIQFGESEMPFVSSGTLLVHDKALLGVLSEMDTEFMEIGGITDVASSHRDAPVRWRLFFPSSLDLPQPYIRRYKNSSATHVAASIKGINHCWRKLFIENSQGHSPAKPHTREAASNYPWSPCSMPELRISC
jgi:hypothetical protein